MIWTIIPVSPSTEAVWQSAGPTSLRFRSVSQSVRQCGEMIKFQGNHWSEIIEEIIIILTILGAVIAVIFSLLILKILATR